jgi:hypothetical protein
MHAIPHKEMGLYKLSTECAYRDPDYRVVRLDLITQKNRYQ